ncbi:MAG: LysR substrate-binding domain-containing protein [Gammaproteobacteria bacterium]
MPLQLRGLRTFCLAAQHLSFKKTADELCLTASAVSHQISDLESELGVKLFMRLTRSIELSDKGMQLYEEVAPYLQAIDDAAIKLKKNANRIPLLVQMPEFFASELLMPIITGFSDQHQDIDLQIESTDSSNKSNPDADINIILSHKTPSAANVEKLFPIRYIPACSRSLYADWKKKGFTGIDAINVSTILLHKARPHAWSRWARHAGIANMKPKQIIFVDSMFALARAAEQGVGIALVPMPVSKAWFDSGSLVPLHSTALVTEDYYWLTLSEKTKNKEAANKFWKWIGKNLQQYAEDIDELNSSVA